MPRRFHFGWVLGASLCCGAYPSAAPAQQQAEFDVAIERQFIDGMNSFAARDYRSAEATFRRILDNNPALLRVRLELARTLFMEKKDEQADYHFRLAAGEHPTLPVLRNIVRFREAIRARRSWRFNFDVGIAPDSNINSATDKQSVDIYGLPFQLDPSARARSGTGSFIGGDASVRLNRFGKIPIYVGAYGRWLRYPDHDFDDAYAGVEAGPEFHLGGGTLRATATGLIRWYGRRPLVKSFGGHFDYEKLVGDRWTLGGALFVRHNDYARRRDVDGWDVEARASANRPLSPTTLGFSYATVERSKANDPGQAFWRERVGVGILKEIGWGLRPQIEVDIAREVNDGKLAPFGKQRRDWYAEGSFSIYKRDWNFGGFAPSLSITMTRNYSTLSLYEEKRLRGELRITKAF
ncbi:MAG TPA: surface lipoprotein assembly modifier [Bradyrhizobium sp.]|uniref:surface lipoprotein assembly modifier n=1 Tax=Bradyrhizobium sp. TaxID=376 RepID=UPI002B47BD36|nr:surface lipoprotein assembly modifier [Bradyrhizobium sp.]HKO69967.1 surface lipoprotein assembly modifier [Bradyrhizobium sp.]